MFILASKSPRRKELLKSIIPTFEIIPSNVDEFKYSLDELSLVKALEIAKDHPNDIIISADTIVILDNKVFGKPQDEKDAYRMLKELSSNVHEVKTIYTIFCEKLHISHTRVITSKVYFNSLSEELISSYIASGSPLDKAGAYGVQDNSSYPIISHIEGSYTNIVGLPVDELKEDLIALKLIA
ncbi:MAG: septum formation protein Maf [Erysipelotrichaceae bacterium]|nr:septum formation protein Maf [Erysipelotrichaceae bacterium]